MSSSYKHKCIQSPSLQVNKPNYSNSYLHNNQSRCRCWHLNPKVCGHGASNNSRQTFSMVAYPKKRIDDLSKYSEVFDSSPYDSISQCLDQQDVPQHRGIQVANEHMNKDP